jgi:hypothetical protein
MNQATPFAPKARPRDLGDDALLDLIQRQTFRYFWDFAHPVSGLARERSNVRPDYGLETVTTGGSGFGAMAIVVAAERGWIGREDARDRLLHIVRFLLRADSYHGILPHFLNGETGRTIPFTRKDDGGDIVETSFLLAGLLCARQYFGRDIPEESELRAGINRLWQEAEWSWHTRDGRHVLYWHWSPNNGWSMDFEIRGWNECLITYLLAASSPRYPVDADVYHRGWAMGRVFRNGRTFYGIGLPLGPDYGGPLFFTHYSFLGLDPRGLADRYADYWQQNVSHVRINLEHCLRNPGGFKGYGADCWGLTASDNHQGYSAHAPDNDQGVISPTAALSSFPYTPAESMRALRHFYDVLGDRIWSEYGFVDAFSETHDWYGTSHLAIDQGPIVVMIENHRTGLLWSLFMSCREIQDGLRKLGFESPHLRQIAAS